VDSEGNKVEDNFSITVAEKASDPGLVLHLDAMAITNLSDGDPVAHWADLSGSGNHAIQNNTANQPSFGFEPNGRPVIHFDGNDDYLELNWQGSGGSLEPDSNSMTVFIVLNNKDIMGESQTIIGNMNESGDVWIHKSGSSNRVYAVVGGNSGTSERLVYFGDKGVNHGFHILTWQYDDNVSSNRHRAYVNGEFIDGADGATTINLGATSIGYESSQGWYWNGYIAEIRIYNYALSDADRRAVEQELHEKWFAAEPVDQYTVTFVDPINGSLSAAVDGVPISSGAEVEESKNIVFTVDTDEGYAVEGWTVNGVTVATETGLTYIHENLSEDIEAAVILAELPARDIYTEELTDITADFGTGFADIGLPATIEVTLEDNSKLNVNVYRADDTYDGNTPGT
jgi:hypothetical protein